MMSALGVYTGSRVDTHAGFAGVEISDSPSRRVHPGDGVHVTQKPGRASRRAGRGTKLKDKLNPVEANRQRNKIARD